MSHCHLDNDTLFTSTRKSKYQISKPSFLISETSSKIIQSIEETIKSKKVNPNGPSNLKIKPVSILNNLQLLKQNNAKSPNRLLSPLKTNISSNISKTPKYYSVSSKGSNHTYQLINAKAALDRKRKKVKELNDKQLAGSSSFHGQKPRRFRLVGKTELSNSKEFNSQLLTSSSFTSKNPTMDSLLKYSQGLEKKNAKGSLSLKTPTNSIYNNRISSIKVKSIDKYINQNKKRKENSPVCLFKNTSFTPINSLKNKFSTPIHTKNDAVSLNTEKIYINQLNENNNSTLKSSNIIKPTTISRNTDNKGSTSLIKVFIYNYFGLI